MPVLRRLSNADTTRNRQSADNTGGNAGPLQVQPLMPLRNAA